MSHTTQLNPQQIKDQADKHDAARDNIKGELETLKTTVDDVLKKSNSSATQALQKKCNDWIDSLEQDVIKHMTTMSENIRNEATNQQGTDDNANAQIMNISMESSDFLGV